MNNERQKFLALNESMAFRFLLDQVLLIDRSWGDSSTRESLIFQLRLILGWCEEHRSEQLQKLVYLRNRLPDNPSYQQFLAIFVPIERQHGRMIQDADFLVSSLDRDLPSREKIPLYLIFDNIRSAFNLGSMIRLADCMNLQKVFLCGFTPRPDQGKVKHAAMNAELGVCWEWRAHCSDLLAELKAQDILVFGLETSSASIPLEEFVFPQAPIAILLGNERFGLESSLLKVCEEIISIPCWGIKNSLNVAVAAGMVSFEIRRQWLFSGYIRQ